MDRFGLNWSKDQYEELRHAVITEIADLKKIYKRRVPKMFYDYAESGSWTEQTFENTSDFDQLKFRQRIAVDMANCDTGADDRAGLCDACGTGPGRSTVCSMPMARSKPPCQEKFGVPFVLSTIDLLVEDVAEHTQAPFWFRVYTLKDDDFMRRLIERARAANVLPW